MPADLAAVAWPMLDGRIDDNGRGPGTNFKAAVPVPEGASSQDKLIGYCGRTTSPSSAAGRVVLVA